MDRIERVRQSFITRKTENSDTHDQIKRHDPEYHKHTHPQHHHNPDHQEDLTDISIESLLIFLEGLKKEKTDDINNPSKPVDQSMKVAIQAYGSNTPHPKKRFTYLDSDNQHVEIAVVNQIIDDLKLLLKSNIMHITLIPASNFLESIQKTVEKIKEL